MACYGPLRAYITPLRDVVFFDKGGYDPIDLACGQCIGCRLERSRQWAMRVLHESSMHQTSCFITLTYDDDHLPSPLDLDYTHFQLFFKRLRKFIEPLKVRFYMCGEYGPKLERPHFHAVIFGWTPPDQVYFKKTESGEKIYTSTVLDRLWGKGFTSVGSVTFESAAYIARYCVAKITGEAAAGHYRRTHMGATYLLTPEFNRMSLKPGVGASWLHKYQSDVYPQDYTIINGQKVKPPKYYDTIFKKHDPIQLAEIKSQREYLGYQLRADNTTARLNVKQQVKTAQVNQLKRTLS